jgi:preprotein translocase subunit SecD
MQLASATYPAALPTQATPPSTPAAIPSSPSTTPATSSAPQYNAQTCNLLGATGGTNLPSTPATQDNAVGGKGYALLPQIDQKTGATVGRYLLGPTELTGRVVSSASAVPPQIGSQWSVQVNFTNAGSPQFDALAAKYVNKQVAIVLDGVVESAPTIQTTSFKGTASITGSFTQSQASNLALQLRYGSLPVQFTPQSIQSVSATIGKDSLRAGLLAGAVGIALVLLYMIFYYRALGVVVIIGLSISGALLYSIISTLSQSSGLSLSLAGATGIIVSVGVTVDSYVVYFERLKDEIRSGKSVRTSVDKSFSRAFRTILAADFVSFLAALILYLTTVGSVRGFAFFLGLSTILDVFTAFFFTRPMVVLLGRNRLFTQARFFGVARGLAASPTGGTA